MEAAPRPTLELLADLPVEEPLDTAGSPRAAASVAPASSAPAGGQNSPTAGKSLDSTGIEFINPETLFGPNAHLASAPPEPPAPPTLSAPPVTPKPARAEPELTLADPREVDRLLPSAPGEPARAPRRRRRSDNEHARHPTTHRGETRYAARYGLAAACSPIPGGSHGATGEHRFIVSRCHQTRRRRAPGEPRRTEAERAERRRACTTDRQGRRR
jgi:hypothetical protein